MNRFSLFYYNNILVYSIYYYYNILKKKEKKELFLKNGIYVGLCNDIVMTLQNCFASHFFVKLGVFL